MGKLRKRTAEHQTWIGQDETHDESALQNDQLLFRTAQTRDDERVAKEKG
jgi:hypothetical protein